MIRTELHTHEIPRLFLRFRDIVEERYWLRRHALIKGEIRGNRYLKEYLERENEIVFTLSRCSDMYRRYQGIPPVFSEDRAIYPTMRFVAQSLSMIDASEVEQAGKLVRRIQGAMNNPEDLRALQLEMAVATHFARRGHDVAWPEMVSQEDTFDLLISDIVPCGLEIECKSVSENKGRKISRREALSFYYLLRPKIQHFSNSLKSGLSVVLTIPSKLPSNMHDTNELIARVVKQIHVGKCGEFDDGVKVSISDFDATELDGLDIAGVRGFRETIDRISSTNNREAMVYRNSGSGVLLFVVQSAQDDRLLDAIFRTLKSSAKRQFSSARPALFMVGLSGISSNSLIDIAEHDADSSQAPTALRVHVSEFLSSFRRDYMIGVCFMSDESFEVGEGEILEGGGKVYMFKREESAFWDESLSGLFL